MTDISEIYRQMHNRRFDLIDERRRARDYQAQLADAEKIFVEMGEACLASAQAMADILTLISYTASRYSVGSTTRAALDQLALEIVEIIEG